MRALFNVPLHAGRLTIKEMQRELQRAFRDARDETLEECQLLPQSLNQSGGIELSGGLSFR